MAVGEVNMSSKRYTEEFKIEAVRQVIDRGYSGDSETDGKKGRRSMVAYLDIAVHVAVAGSQPHA